MTTDEERWAQAEEILRNGPGPDARRRMRQRKILFDLAERVMLSYRSLFLVFLGVLLTYGGQLVTRPIGWHLWLPLAAIALWLVAIPLALRNSRRMQRFLAEHPPPD